MKSFKVKVLRLIAKSTTSATKKNEELAGA